MRIAVISTLTGVPWTGSEELWAAMAAEALKQEHRVAISVYNWPQTPPKLAQLEQEGARVWKRARTRLPSLDWVLGKLLRRPVKVPRPSFAPSAFHTLFNWKPDVICLSQGWPFESLPLHDLRSSLAKSGVPYVVVCQANIEGPVDAGARDEGRIFLEKAERVIWVSQGNLCAAQRQLAAPLAHSVVLRNPVNLNDRSLVPWPIGGCLRMASVGRWDVASKGQDILFEALAGEDWQDRDWRLRLYGQGHDQPYLERLARHYHITGHIEFAGHVSDVREIWANNHLLVMPSRTEGTPLAMVEAMFCGRPAVVTDVAGNTEWIEEGHNGFVAEAPTARSFGAALERAWRARHDWQALGRAAHESAEQKYDPDPGLTLLKILQDAAQKKPCMRGADEQ